MRICAFCAAIVVALVLATTTRAVNLFTDTFDAPGSATNYTEVSSGQTQLTYAYDYSAMGIPVAPHTSGSSAIGLKLEANVSAGAISAVTLHTTKQFSGAYNVRFDAWLNANGKLTGTPLAVGSTQFLTAGVGGDSATVNGSTTTSNAQNGSGGWAAVTGDAGAARDFRLHKNGTEAALASGQYAAGATGNAQDSVNTYYATTFPATDLANLPVQGANNGGPAQQTGLTPVGCAGFAWRTVELRVNPTGGTGGAASMAWYIDGLRIGTLDAGNGGAFNASGPVTIGYWDPFASIADNTSLIFGLIDNLVVSNADFNVNSVVDAADYVEWRKNNGLLTGATNAQGDANGDGKVDATDYNLWRSTFGVSGPISGGGRMTGSAIPEPSALALTVATAIVAGIGRRPKAKSRVARS